ncbi:MAG: hypothetical protein WBE26_10420 [Phycisphaerae bacterium]
MAEDPAVLRAIKPIEDVLRRFVRERGEAKVLVETQAYVPRAVVNEFGHLFAVVATGAFEGMPQRERQRAVWDYLRQNARPEDLAHVYQIYALTTREYDARVLSASQTSGALDLFIQGTNSEETANE